MLNRIVSFFRDVRIKIDFSSYEKQCRLEHERRAESTHSTRQLETELSAKASQIHGQADSLFCAKISHLSGEITQLNIVISQKKAMLGIFTRNYSNELQKLYERKKTLFSQKNDAFSSMKALDAPIESTTARKSSAYASVSYYQSCINSWHAKSKRSPWLFGNGGKKMPKHALFGQSFGDLDSYKSSRDSAYSEVQNCKNEMDRLYAQKSKLSDQIREIKNDIDDANNKINTIKSDQDHMYALKKEGYSRAELQKTLSNLNESIATLQSRLNALEAERTEFIVAERYRQGVTDLEGKIQTIRDKKYAFLKSFDLDEIRNLRIKKHRQIWMQERGFS
jgi:chromosome segregation ATPase